MKNDPLHFILDALQLSAMQQPTPADLRLTTALSLCWDLLSPHQKLALLTHPEFISLLQSADMDAAKLMSQFEHWAKTTKVQCMQAGFYFSHQRGEYTWRFPLEHLQRAKTQDEHAMIQQGVTDYSYTSPDIITCLIEADYCRRMQFRSHDSSAARGADALPTFWSQSPLAQRLQAFLTTL